MRRILLKFAAIVGLAVLHGTLPANASVVSSDTNCGQCMSSCPSMWEVDAFCLAICGQRAVGWCPANSDLCGFWEERVTCQGAFEA